VDLRRNIRRVATVLVLSFLAPLAMLVYWQAVRAPALRAQPSNHHAAARRKRTERGEIVSVSGTRLAFNQRLPDGKESRSYPLQASAAQLVGYDSDAHGLSGLEQSQDEALMALGPYADVWGSLSQGRRTGCEVRVTIDPSTQQAAYAELAFQRGAVVVIEPGTGAILALASSPSFDPNHLDEDWDDIQNAPASPLLNRATAGLYRAGGAFRLILAADALDSGKVQPDEAFSCSGEMVIRGTRVVCSRRGGHGRVSLREAFQDNCSVAFAQIADRLGPDEVRRCFASLRLANAPDIGVPCVAGGILGGGPEKPGSPDAADGLPIDASVTPLAMARLAACLGNEGIMMEPYVVSDILTPRGQTRLSVQPQTAGRVIGKHSAALLTGWMTASLRRGLGGGAEIPDVSVARVTGTAAGPAGRRDSWFLGFAPVRRPEVAIAVVMEDVGPHGEHAAWAAYAILSRILSSGALASP
jgi:peptidoglycan glycosyltransferase